MQEPDYPLLHEIARHMIHVSETLAVASQSVKGLQQQHQDFITKHLQSKSSWNRIQNRFQFQQQILQSLLSRSKSNNARLQNEITLVGSEYMANVQCTQAAKDRTIPFLGCPLYRAHEYPEIKTLYPLGENLYCLFLDVSSTVPGCIAHGSRSSLKAAS